MPTPALSLVGFMDQQPALQHLRVACVSANNSDAALLAEWNAAQAKLGAPIPNAGLPQISALPPTANAHIAALTATRWCQNWLQGALAGSTFQLVEIEPLLAFQFTIDKARSQTHCGALRKAPTIQETLDICLPVAPVSESLFVDVQPQSAIIKARSLNVQMMSQGVNNGEFAGIHFGVTVPLVQVVRFNGRCYLHNGFHRALGLRIAGATHIACAFRDVNTYQEVGIKDDGNTFTLAQLSGVNPPTLAHFSQGRAYDVQLRRFSRVLHVAWSQYVVPDE